MNPDPEKNTAEDGAGKQVGKPAGDWVVVEQFANGVDADMARVLLEGQGLPVVLENREFVGMDSGLAAAVGWIKVLAPPDRAAEASEILALAASVRGADVQMGEAPALHDSELCLSCGGAMPASESVCKACGWSYTETLTAEQDDVAVYHSRRRAQAPPDFSATENKWSPVVAAIAVAAAVVFVLMAILDHL